LHGAAEHAPDRVLRFAAPSRRQAGACALALVAAAGAMWMVLAPAPVDTGLRAAPGGALHVVRDQIVDSAGDVVTLRGTNDSALLPGGPPLDESDAGLMADAGFDVVRLPISWAAVEPDPGRFDASYLARIRSAVELFGRHRIWSIVDMHFGVAWGPGSNVPAWAQLGAVPDIHWLPMHPFRDSTSPRAVASEEVFWTTPGWRSELAAAWTHVAAAVGGEPWLAGYDLYNEPHPLPMPPVLFEHRFLFPLYGRLIAAIGKVDAGHLFIVESTLFASLPTPTERLVAPDVVYEVHLYTGSLINAPWYRGSPSQVQAGELDERLREAAAIPAPVFVGEFGDDMRTSSGRAWTGGALAVMARLGIGWTWWQWRGGGHWDLRSVSGGVYARGLRMLATPYVRAGPRSVTWSWDGRRLTLESPHPAAVEVSWPAQTAGRPAAGAGCSMRGQPPAVAVTVTGRCVLETASAA
jgi:endoglycosylceramidase